MEKVVAAVIGSLSNLKGSLGMPAGLKTQGTVSAVIEKNIRPGQFWATLETGDRIRVRSAADLSVGQKVTVLVPKAVEVARPEIIAPLPAVMDKGTNVWTALIPFDFGTGEGSAKLEVFTEKTKKHSLEKAARASYLVFTTDFENGDTLQWSVYIKGKHLALQIYSTEKTAERHNIDKLSREIEKRLKKLGFALTLPTTRLVKPFKVPQGFNLNVRV
jgi:hypothetical protein